MDVYTCVHISQQGPWCNIAACFVQNELNSADVHNEAPSPKGNGLAGMGTAPTPVRTEHNGPGKQVGRQASMRRQADLRRICMHCTAIRETIAIMAADSVRFARAERFLAIIHLVYMLLLALVLFTMSGNAPPPIAKLGERVAAFFSSQVACVGCILGTGIMCCMCVSWPV